MFFVCLFLMTRSLEDFEDFTSLTALYQHQMFNYIGLMFYIKYGKITSMTTDDVAVVFFLNPWKAAADTGNIRYGLLVSTF